MKNNKGIFITIFSVGLSVAPSQGYATEKIDSVQLLDEVNIVAMKQEEKLRGEALSSTVIEIGELEQMNAVSLKGLSDAVPNFYMPDYGSRTTSSMYVRGIGARMDQPSVGLSVDNVPYLNKNAYDFDLADIRSVEMLRGPQSTLFGRNTMGGLVNITTLSPLKWQGWRLSAGGGMGNDWRASLGWYHKFNAKSALAVIGNFSYLGGFFRNKYDGKLLDHEKSGGLRLKFDWRISSSVYLQNAFSTSVLRQGGYPYESLASGEINYNDPCFYNRFTITDGLTLRWRHDKFSMTSVTTLQWLDDNMTLDQDFLPDPYFTLTQKQKDFGITEDIVFKGDAGKYHWMAGAFGFYKHLGMDAPVTFKDKGISELIEKHRNDANPYYPISWHGREFVLNSDFGIPTYGAAVYHQSRYDLDRWHFSAGIRLDYESSRMRYHSNCDTGYDIMQRKEDGELVPYLNKDIAIDEHGKLRRSYFNWMPKLTALWNFSGGESNVYASLSKGWKSGGFNTQMFSEVLQQRVMIEMGVGASQDIDKIVGYKPEYSWNYEIGGHFSLAGGKIMADVSLFFIDCRDQQLTVFPEGTTTGRMMTNAGRTHSFGGELSIEYSPIAELRFDINYGYTNARFVRFVNGKENYKGKYVPYAPQNTLYISGEWRKPIGNRWISEVVTNVNMRGTGKIYWNEANTHEQPFYALLGADVTLVGKGWSFQIWGRNITDTDYRTFYFMSMGNEFVQKGRPVQVGATLRLEL